MSTGTISVNGTTISINGLPIAPTPSPAPSNELPAPVPTPSDGVNGGPVISTRNVSTSGPLPSNPKAPTPSLHDVVPPASPIVAAPATSSGSPSPSIAQAIVPYWPSSPSTTYAPPLKPPNAGGGHDVAAIIVAAVATLLVILALAVLGWFYRRRKRKRTNAAHVPAALTRRKTRGSLSSTSTDFLISPSPAGPRRFSYEQLSIATNNFSESELLGRGGFGSVYKGKLDVDEDGTLVAVKRIQESSSQGYKEFRAEVSIISDLRHRNLVRLRGWCHDEGTFLLVYDYMPNGSLDHLLFDDKLCAKLSWERRYSIALGLGSALQYLHEECDNVIIHRDIKSSNVLLDESFNAKLGDFGLARQMNQGLTAHTTSVAGTHGYMAPECLIGLCRATRETDVYAFGAVLLELVCGKRALDARRLEEDDAAVLVEWVWRLHGHDRLMEAVDERLKGRYDKEKARKVLVVGMACSFPDPKARPKIRQVLEALMGSAALPLVPLSRPPVIIFGSSGPPAMRSQCRVMGDSSTATTNSSSMTHSSSSSSSDCVRPGFLTMP